MVKISDLILFLVVLYLIFNKVNVNEKMSNTDIKKIIQNEYKIDVDAIRNLSKLANDLTVNRKLVVPGGLEIQGKIKMKGLELYPDSANCLVVKNSNGQAAIGSRNKYYFHIDSNREVYFYKNISAAGDINAKGNGYFGPAYIGKYGKTRSDYAQFSHINQTGTTNYAITQHKGGSSMLNAPSGKSASIRVGDSVKLNVTGNVDIKNKITSNNLEVKGWADFGTSSNRKMRVVSTSYSDYTTYLSFYKGSKRVNFILPKTNGKIVDSKWRQFAR